MPKILFILFVMVNLVICVFNKKITMFGMVLVVFILLANITVGNTSTVDLLFENTENSPYKGVHKTDTFPDSEYIIVRGNNRLVYLMVPSDLDDETVEQIKEAYLEQTENEEREDSPPVFEIEEGKIESEETKEGHPAIETEELEIESEVEPVIHLEKPILINLPDSEEVIEIKEITIIENTSKINSKTDKIPFIEQEDPEEIKNFSSYHEFMTFLGYKPISEKNNSVDCVEPEDVPIVDTADSVRYHVELSSSTKTSSPGLPAVNSGSGYSITNVQVIGVDEGDIIKNDDKYAYIVTKDKYSILIAEVFPAETAKVLSKVTLDGAISEIYIYGDMLVLLGSKCDSYNYYPYSYCYSQYYSNNIESFVYIFDIKDKVNPILMDSYIFEGSIVQSRLIGDYVYLIANQYITQNTKEEDLPVHPSQIYYFDNSETSYRLTVFTSINVTNASEGAFSRAILMGTGNNIFVSLNNVYITYTKYIYDNSLIGNSNYYSSRRQYTIIHRISVENGHIQYRAMGDVTGSVLNRYSMDEYLGYFRIATTEGNVWSSGEDSAKNSVFILDMDMNTVGSLTNIAPGEKIYSARFMGDRAYLVTFKKVDPFFVIDLVNPEEPKILGELKIPGYSNYLHPYDENHVIGIGKHTVEAADELKESRGIDFAWYQGVKLSLFDVSDVQNPKEISQFIIGDRGTDSLALNDPHAFLFSREKNLLVIPIRLYEINETKYPNGAEPNTMGEYTWNGAYVFHISSESGFLLKGRITHSNENEIQSGYSYWNWNSEDLIKRSFYIQDVLYTFSDVKLKMNDIDNLNDINELVLNDEDTGYIFEDQFNTTFQIQIRNVP